MRFINRYDRISVFRLKSITLLAILTAISAIGRIVFSFIPNVQPVTTLVIFVTLLMGARYGLIHAVLVVFLSNLMLGLGIWTIGQMFGYAVIVLLTAFFVRPFFNRLPFVIMTIYSALTGFIYGFVQALFQAPLYGFDYFYIYYLSGIAFDFYHALGNALFYFILAPFLLPLLDRRLDQYSKNQVKNSKK